MLNYCRYTLIFWALVACSTLCLADPSPECIVTEFSQLSDAIDNCLEIVVRNVTVPGGTTAEFKLKDGASLTFEGTTTFEHYDWPEWNLSLMRFEGNNITVEGASGHVLDGQGALYWDGIGDKGPPKPFFITIAVTNSILRNINLLNCPHHCTIINGSDGVTLTGWNIDCSHGDGNGGHNTDGFDVVHGNNVVIEDSTVVNQDDCVAVNQGFNMSFSGLRCSGSHGISLSVGFSKTSYIDNTVKNVTYSNCTLTHSSNAIHIKTHNDGGPGEITDVTYQDISFTDITSYGINIEQDYANGGPTGELVGNVPITNLQFYNIKGTVSSKAMPVYIYCADDACIGWNWSDIVISGGNQDSSCNYVPEGYTC
ncbi:hypothetical protein NQ318_016041 [Aromia moschata]|uniref:endo-polygalacturonase n=1 Tax=Aromia moschata TaxID=1265417 RepID=A0AAV8Y1P9_9CUCU|nr:hypothetical protein NQ318_016041 [Aromia moschata]